MLGQFDKMVEDYGCTVIDASRSIGEVYSDLKDQMAELLNPSRPVFSDSIGRLKQPRNGTATQGVLRVERSGNRLSYINGRPSGNGVVELSATNLRRRSAGE
jgi:hypothetical protein